MRQIRHIQLSQDRNKAPFITAVYDEALLNAIRAVDSALIFYEHFLVNSLYNHRTNYLIEGINELFN